MTDSLAKITVKLARRSKLEIAAEDEFSLLLSVKESLGGLKRKIQEIMANHPHPSHQLLVYNGICCMEDKQTLADICKTEENDLFFDLILSLPFRPMKEMNLNRPKHQLVVHKGSIEAAAKWLNSEQSQAQSAENPDLYRKNRAMLSKLICAQTPHAEISKQSLENFQVRPAGPNVAPLQANNAPVPILRPRVSVLSRLFSIIGSIMSFLNIGLALKLLFFLFIFGDIADLDFSSVNSFQDLAGILTHKQMLIIGALTLYYLSSLKIFGIIWRLIVRPQNPVPANTNPQRAHSFGSYVIRFIVKGDVTRRPCILLDLVILPISFIMSLLPFWYCQADDDVIVPDVIVPVVDVNVPVVNSEEMKEFIVKDEPVQMDIVTEVQNDVEPSLVNDATEVQNDDCLLQRIEFDEPGMVESKNQEDNEEQDQAPQIETQS